MSSTQKVWFMRYVVDLMLLMIANLVAFSLCHLQNKHTLCLIFKGNTNRIPILTIQVEEIIQISLGAKIKMHCSLKTCPLKRKR